MSSTPDCPAHRSGTELGAHLSLLRRRWLLFLGCFLAGGTMGLALMRLTPPAYTATTQVLVTPVGVPEQGNQVTARQREQLNLDTEAQIARSGVVAAAAAQIAGIAEPEPVEVTVPPNSAVLLMTVTAPDPVAAATQSRAYADAYLAHRADGAQAAITSQQKLILAKLKQVNAALAKAVTQLGGLRRGTAEHTLALHRQGVLNRQASSLTLKYDALKTVPVTPGSVISPAEPPSAPSSPSLPLHLASGLVAGLLAGAGAASLRDRLDTRLRTAADVERLTGLPVLADLARPAELATSVVSACPGKWLLVKAVPAELGTASVIAPLAASAPLSVLNGAEVGDLGRADAAVLLVGLGEATAEQVAAAVRQVGRHRVPVIGVVTTTDLTPAPVPEPRRPNTLGKLVASGELAESGALTTPMSTPVHTPAHKPVNRPVGSLGKPT
ncbi:Wzz/FepE/Etk N-terminal domain-containing protein [Nonomuraea ceibae]|uniref:Wzz/FepE/Etk N-terminal domain-containing protein n=1 Tax=Nonomuraea ceibae TaxID=1935170 RepID=UPI001C5E9DA4|nr:Wzz/FepE/Etk N-terminal domain-containing protein [Nonomuraea ceibae]